MIKVTGGQCKFDLRSQIYSKIFMDGYFLGGCRKVEGWFNGGRFHSWLSGSLWWQRNNRRMHRQHINGVWKGITSGGRTDKTWTGGETDITSTGGMTERADVLTDDDR